MSHILHGRLPLTEKLARDIRATLGISLPEPGEEAQREDVPSHPDRRGQHDALSG